MNSDIFKGKWMQLRGIVRKQWGKLTDDDLDQVQGDMDRLAGVIQERYGYTKEEAHREVDRFVSEQDTDQTSDFRR